MAYQIKYIEREKIKGWGIICPDGRLCNDFIWPEKADAERKLNLLQAWYEKNSK